MKKIIVSLFTIAAAFGFGGCAQSDVDDNSGFVSGNGKPFVAIGTANANIALEGEDDTRATVTPNGDKYRPVFNEGDELRVFELYDNGEWFCVEVPSTEVASSSTTVTRTVYQEAPRQDYLLFYPASALESGDDAIKGYGATPTVKLTVPTVQYPTADAPDTDATILYAYAKNVEHATNADGDLQKQLGNFKSLTAYGKMTLKGLEDGKEIENVKVTILGYTLPQGGSTTSYITGTFNNYKFDKEYESASSEYYDPKDAEGANYVELDYSKNPLTVNNGEAVVWFSVMANKYLAGNESVGYASSFIVDVKYTDSDDTVTKQFFNKKNGNDVALKFKNGAVTTLGVNMTQTAGGGPEPEHPTEFKKVTNPVVGNKYIFVISDGSRQYVMRNDGNHTDSNPSDPTPYAINVTELGTAGLNLQGDKLTTADASSYTFLMSTENVPGDSYSKYKFYSTTKPDKWLRIYASNTLILSGNASTYQYDGLNVGEDGTTLFKSNGANFTSNIYVYTDGNIVKADYDEHKVITIFGVDTDTNVGPDMTEPLLEEKLTIVSGTANQAHNGHGSSVNNLWDGVVNNDSDNAIYHSPYSDDNNGLGSTGTLFPVVLEFNFDVVSNVYRMHYYTRLATNSNGLPGGCNVEYQTADGVWRQAKAGTFNSDATAMYQFNKQRGSNQTDNGGFYHEANFSAAPLMGAQAVRLTFFSGSNNFLTGTEVIFYGEKTVSTPTQQYEKLKITSGKASSEHKEFTSGGTRYVATPIEKLFDGIIGTDADDQIYHSKWGWVEGATNEFPITLSFYINKSDVAEFHYYTKLSATNTANGNVANGMPGQFDVRYRCYGDAEDSYRKINPSDNGTIANAKYDMGQTAHAPYKITFDEVLKDVIEMQLIFYSGSHDDGTAGYIAGREVEIWGIPAN